MKRGTAHAVSSKFRMLRLSCFHTLPKTAGVWGMLPAQSKSEGPFRESPGGSEHAESVAAANARARSLGVRSHVSPRRVPGTYPFQGNLIGHSAREYVRRRRAFRGRRGHCGMGPGPLPQGSHHHGPGQSLRKTGDLGTLPLHSKPNVCRAYFGVPRRGGAVEADLASRSLAFDDRLPPVDDYPRRRGKADRSFPTRIRTVSLARPPLDLGDVSGSAGRLLEGLAVPMSQLRAGFVGGLTKFQKCGAGRRRPAHVVIHQEELAELRVVLRGLRLDASLAEARRLGSHVGIEGGRADAAAGPKADAADFVGIRFTRDGIGARALGSAAAGKARHRMVEAAPEKMHRAGLAQKARAELLENAVHGDEDLAEPPHGFGIVGGVNLVLVKGNRIGNFHRHFPNAHLDTGRMQHAHELAVKIRHGSRKERERDRKST